jgi:DNA-binding transcriptional LysR family regulator
MDAYPEIEVQLILEDSEHDLMAFDVDCALRPWPSTQGDLIERRLGHVTQSLYASPSYLADHGAPRSAEDLDNHKIVAFGDLLPAKLQSSNWVLTAGLNKNSEPRKPVLSINNLHGIMRAAEAGIGLAGLPDYMTTSSRRLVRVLPDIRGESFELFFVYPTELRGSAKAKVFREYLQKIARSSPSFE